MRGFAKRTIDRVVGFRYEAPGGQRGIKVQQLPLPAHFDPERVREVWQVPYAERAEQAAAWAREHSLRPAAEDGARVCLVLVDCQNTFCIPEFELFVGGRSGRAAIDDSRRLCEFIYRNLGAITQIFPSLDTHHAMQVFHAIWLVDEYGKHPDPFTLVTAEEVESGRWSMNTDVARALGIDAEYAERHLLHYTRRLAEGGKRSCLVRQRGLPYLPRVLDAPRCGFCPLRSAGRTAFRVVV